jgi:hypothetical protein
MMTKCEQCKPTGSSTGEGRSSSWARAFTGERVGLLRTLEDGKHDVYWVGIALHKLR